MVKISIDITNKELDALEDFIVAWNLCNKHNEIIDASEEQRFSFIQTCKKCAKINRELRHKSLRVWNKLVDAYSKGRKK